MHERLASRVHPHLHGRNCHYNAATLRQGDYHASSSSKADQPVPEATTKRKVLTTLGSSGACLGTPLLHDESWSVGHRRKVMFAQRAAFTQNHGHPGGLL